MSKIKKKVVTLKVRFVLIRPLYCCTWRQYSL